jgi:hypothetical protein
MALNQSLVKFNDLYTKTLQFSLFHTVTYCKALLNEQIEVCSSDRKATYNCSVLSNTHTADETSKHCCTTIFHMSTMTSQFLQVTVLNIFICLRKIPLGVCSTLCGTNSSYKTLYQYEFQNKTKRNLIIGLSIDDFLIKLL